MLKRIKIGNFRGIKNGEIRDLGKVNVFIGRNNSGKSCILDALCLSRCAFNLRLWEEPLLLLLLRRRGIERSTYTLRNFWFNYDTRNNIILDLESDDSRRLCIEIRWMDDERLHLCLKDPSGVLGTSVEDKYFHVKGVNLEGGYYDVGGNIDAFSKQYPQFHRYLSEITLIDDYLARKLERLETTIFSRILEPRLDKKVIEELNEIYNMEAEGLTYIPVSPTIKAFRLAVTMPKESLHIDELGDGTKYATNILSLCLLLENSAFLIEEPESHQHSEAVKKFLPALLKIARERNVQLFITTHSLEVLHILFKLSEEYDIRFFHVMRSSNGELNARQFSAIDAKLLSDIGVDIRLLETYKKFIVFEGNEDKIFIESLCQKYDKNIEELGYFVNAGGKDLIKQISAALVSTGKDILIILDYDGKEKAEPMDDIANVLRGHSYHFEQKNNIFKIKETGSALTVLPLGLPDDETLRKIGVTCHEMEDYCLKLLEVDENLNRWAEITLEELATDAKKAKLKNSNRSKTLLQLLCGKKGISYEDTIEYIIKHASKDNVEKVAGNVKTVLI